MRVYRSLGLVLVLLSSGVGQAQPLAPITSVQIGPNRDFQVNGKPFLPVMIWLQDPANFPLAQRAGINTICGYYPESGGTKDVVEYQAKVKAAGMYGVMPYHAGLKGDAALLGYIHGDEPDLSHDENDAQAVPAPAMHINNSTPLWKIVDGETSSWSVLDPLKDAVVTVKFKQPVTVTRFGLWPTVSAGLALPKEIELLGDGKPLAKATLTQNKGRQEVALPAPATFSELALHVISTYPDKNEWGSLGEIEGFDAAGRNVLLSPPRKVPRQLPAAVQQEYRTIKAADPSRPVFMTLTGDFLPHFKTWPDARREELYPAYVQAADVVGYDIYPIYGWGRPDWIHLTHDATQRLGDLAGTRPTYAWIETSGGGQWVDDKVPQPVSPAHIRCEVWQAICRGATAIGYFTHVWKPAYKQFGVPPENVAAMKAINDQLTRLTPMLLSGPSPVAATVKLADDGRADLLVREHAGSLYLCAVNYDPRPVKCQGVLTVPGLKAGTTIEVIDEGRTLTAGDGRFEDGFEAYAVHLYRMPRP